MGLSAHEVARIIGDDYNRHVADSAPDDFWGQVKRHVFGRPVGADQIELIVDAATRALSLEADDVLLDLGCGNGALAHHLFGACSEYFGVDISTALVTVANANFAAGPHFAFTVDDVADYVSREARPERFTKVMCYGTFPYLVQESATHVLQTLATRFPNVRRVFLGNLPDLERVNAFYPGVSALHPALGNPLSEIGIWRTPDVFKQLAEETGWSVELTNMPSSFYAAHYRYDATLSRKPAGY
jgi:cyclopropane fatty-acyl-phospholipid synthase-like methyltransferase